MPGWKSIIRIALSAGICLVFFLPTFPMTAQTTVNDGLQAPEVVRIRHGESSSTDQSVQKDDTVQVDSRPPNEQNHSELLELIPAQTSETGSWVVRFSHETHNKQDCLTCHRRTALESEGPVKVEACFGCHNEAIASGRCRDCHGKDRFFPTNHKPAGKWRKRHGYRANVLVFPDRRSWNRVKTGHAFDCSGCHRDDQCRKCHQFSRPESHTGFWRIRGHGLRGLVERESCAVCHGEMFCVRCHKTTRPINHVGNWNMLHGRAVSQSTAERCWVCHPRVISRIRVGNAPECNYCHPQ